MHVFVLQSREGGGGIQSIVVLLLYVVVLHVARMRGGHAIRSCFALCVCSFFSRVNTGGVTIRCCFAIFLCVRGSRCYATEAYLVYEQGWHTRASPRYPTPSPFLLFLLFLLFFDGLGWPSENLECPAPSAELISCPCRACCRRLGLLLLRWLLSLSLSLSLLVDLTSADLDRFGRFPPSLDFLVPFLFFVLRVRLRRY